MNLLSRSVALLPAEDHASASTACRRSRSPLIETGDFARLETVGSRNERSRRRLPTIPVSRRMRCCLGLWIRLFTNPEGWAEDAMNEATRAIEVVRAGSATTSDSRRAGHCSGSSICIPRSSGRPRRPGNAPSLHAHRAGNMRDELESLSWVPICVWAGPTPAAEALERCQSVIERARGDKKAISTALFVDAELEAGLGNFGERAGAASRARGRLLEELALTVWIAGPLAPVRRLGRDVARRSHSGGDAACAGATTR